MKGSFITLEGGEGTGKTTQAFRIFQELQQHGRDVVLTREPGGTAAGEAVRSLVVSGATGTWSASEEAMLMSVARSVHVREVILPALARNAIVICDRFADSTRVYQGYAGGCEEAFLNLLQQQVTQGLSPNLTLVFDLDPVIGLARAKARADGSEDRFERKGLGFHQKLRQGFLGIAEEEPKRCKVIDAGQGPDAVFTDALKHVDEVLHGLG